MLSRAVLLPRDFDMDFLDRLVAVTAPGQASLLLVTRREFDRFLHLSKEAGREFETHRTQEGVLVLL
ncbi:MAG: hypothetical protein R3228_13620 [Halioglobus sp.]|nr:hypothetical protein [Halioglobus sp.]